MWQARLQSVDVDLDKTVDALSFTIEFFHEDERTTVKKYIIYVDELSTVDLASLKAQVQVDLDRLEKVEEIVAVLGSKIGQVM